jgi:hypothetical protein
MIPEGRLQMLVPQEQNQPGIIPEIVYRLVIAEDIVIQTSTGDRRITTAITAITATTGITVII